MVLMSAASDHHHHPAAKSSMAPPSSSYPSPAPAPSTTATYTRTRLHGFSFPTLSWGSHRLLRCSKDGASASASPPQHPSPGKGEKPRDQAAAGASPPQRPWNLRTRRSATTAPLASRSDGAGRTFPSGPALQSPAPPPQAEAARKRGFSLALTKEEIAEDFAAICGARPARRPRKRPRAVQRQLDALFPGFSLADVNLDSYKIDER